MKGSSLQLKIHQWKSFSYWSNVRLYRFYLQHLCKALSKPAGNVSRVKGEEKESVLAASPPVDGSGVCWQDPSDGSDCLLCTAQKLKLGSVAFRQSCVLHKFVFQSLCSHMNEGFHINYWYNSAPLWRQTYSASGKYSQRFTCSTLCHLPGLFQNGLNSFPTQNSTHKPPWWPSETKCLKNKKQIYSMYISYHSLCHETQN